MNEVVRWDEELARSAKEIATRERPSVSQISLRAGVMQYRGQIIPGNKLKCVIISSCIERRYDTKNFDPDNILPPDCFALSISGENVAPCPESPVKQAESCSNCPQNAWQPHPRRPGKKHKPCKERRRLALLPYDSVASGNIKNAELAMLAIPVTSVKHWGTFVNRIAAEYARPPWAVYAEISVTPHPQTQFEVKFEPIGVVEDEHLGMLRQRIEGANEVILTPYDSSGYMVPEDAAEGVVAEKKTRKF